MKPALAIFVKTPGLSPIKTRLAAGIGEAAATQFYIKALMAVQAVVDSCTGFVSPHWAVAEHEALGTARWSGYPRVYQGAGGLGDRLDAVYSTLLHSHGAVLMIGTDAPQITQALLQNAVRALDLSAFALGRACDGGFWLFAGKKAVPTSVWTTVPYSESGTAAMLQSHLIEHGPVHELDKVTDVDYDPDLDVVRHELSSLLKPLPEQQAMLTWIDTLRTLPAGA
ncbi:TIGR04282 family arsenosugar biosynthesis glycosyltransferase [Nevskia soli]|uniref:TIGR04282 family arsenosugar biosynthesis glycosyltransferase n=1 Tax=Nevskia soli TaxID=418856 RepID=UPI0004A710AA|nr:DUF2064 domain-containing protein [Nevskia soli]